MNTKSKNIAYWVTTILIAFFIGTGGIAQIAQYLGNPNGVVPLLGYPMYFFAILGFWKALGAIAILVPRYPRLKEWAYAGIFFDLTRGRIRHCGRRVRCLRLSHHRSSRPYWSHCGIVGAAAGESCHRHPYASGKQRGREGA
jgi:DoxX-like family